MNIKLYKFENNNFVLKAIIDDIQQISWEHNLYSAGQFTISINYNIPNARLFERGLFVQFENDPYMFGEISTITNSIGQNGKGSEMLNISGYDARYLFKRRVIKNLNNNETWSMTAKGELCMRNLVADQCGSNAEIKRRLPITNIIPEASSAIGEDYSVSESFSSLYDVLVTIATQSKIGWRIKFDGSLTLEVYNGNDLSNSVFLSTDYESLANGSFSDTSNSFANSIYIAGKGSGSERDLYEGENGTPSGFDRFEAYDNQSSMSTEEEYKTEAENMLIQYGQTITISGAGLVKCPYIFKQQYNIGDTVTVEFSGKRAAVQILSVTESWNWNKYGLSFNFGKPRNSLDEQLQLMLRKLSAASNTSSACESVKWYNIANETSQEQKDVTFNTLGFTGAIPSGGRTFTLYRDDEGTGAKSYTIYTKNLSGSDNLIITTGVVGATNFTFKPIDSVARILVDTEGNIVPIGLNENNITTEISEGNNNIPTSDAVNSALSNIGASVPTGTMFIYGGSVAPDGWLVCDGSAISRSTYAELFGVIGTSYGVGDGSTTFNIPDMRDRFVQGASTSNPIGTKLEAGIPNITTQDNDGSNTSGYMLWSMGNTYANNNIKAGTTYGAVSTMAGATPYGVQAGNIDFPYGLNFNAKNGETKTDGTLKTSNEHHVYGASDTVQPPAVCMNYIIKY